jgi:hypothetical protein
MSLKKKIAAAVAGTAGLAVVAYAVPFPPNQTFISAQFLKNFLPPSLPLLLLPKYTNNRLSYNLLPSSHKERNTLPFDPKATPWRPPPRPASIARAKSETFDVVVIGGGCVGTPTLSRTALL